MSAGGFYSFGWGAPIIENRNVCRQRKFRGFGVTPY
jgi:hypothetical protein